MNIIICGAGEVGRYAGEVLGGAGNNITIIDLKPDKLQAVQEAMDVRTLEGNGAHADVLLEAGCSKADVFIAATQSDEVNLLAAAVASGVGVGRSIARVHHSAYMEQLSINYGQILGIDHLLCPEHTTAVAIAQSLRNPGALAVERFARGKIEMQQLPVSDRAPAIGKTLSQVNMPASVRVATISSQGKAYIPTRNDIVKAGDIVTLVGDVDSFEQARQQFHLEKAKRKRVMIMGGTPMGVWLCRALRSRGFAVRLFEADSDRCTELAQKLPWVTVLRADPSDSQALEQEQVSQADAFVALTQDDEHNILMAARAKSLGAQQAIAVLKRPTYQHLLEHVGIDRAFSPRVTAVNQVERLLRTAPVEILATLVTSVADVYEVHVSCGAKEMVGIPLRELQLPSKCIVVAIERENRVFVPGANDPIRGNDTVVVIGPSNLTKTLGKTMVN